MAKKYNSVVIAHHTYTLTSLCEEELLQYLLPIARHIDYLTHPFKDARDDVPSYSTIVSYVNGKKTKTRIGWTGWGPEPLYFLRDFFYTMWTYLFRRTDLFVGVDNLNAFCGIILKRIGRVETVVYYVIDYVPERFSNRALNSIYHWVDLFCVRHADATWNLAEAMVEAREAIGLETVYRQKQYLVPVGTHPNQKAHPRRSDSPKRLVFLGILNEDQGIDQLIEAMPGILRRVPDTTLTVIGSGPLLGSLQERVVDLRLADAISFTGFIKSNQDVDRLLSTCDIGLAPYRIHKNSFKYFTDPGKIKTYLSSGLAVLMARISHIAQVIEKEQAGIIIEDSPEALANGIVTLLISPDLAAMQERARVLGKNYDWQTIFTEVFAAMEHHEV